MPRSVDLVPQNFKSDYDPTNQLATDPALQKAMDQFSDVIQQLQKMAQAELKRLIDTLAGIATNPIPEIVHWLEELKKGLSNILSWISPGLLPLIPLGQIGEWYPNLLLNGGFDTDVSVANNPDWLWDGTVGRSNPLGSVKAIMSGVPKSLKSNEIPVVKGQHLELEAFASWQGVTAAVGTDPIRLVITAYQGGAQVLSTVIARLQPTTANSSGWTELHGTYTVPDGVDQVRTTLLVTGDVTAGTVWFDDADTWKTGKLPQDYVQDLAAQLQQFTHDISSAFDELAKKVGLDKFKEFFDTIGGKVNAELADIINRLQAITADGKVDAAEILGLLGLGNIPQLPQHMVIDLTGDLGHIADNIAAQAVTLATKLAQGDFNGFLAAIFGIPNPSNSAVNQKFQHLGIDGTLAGNAITGAISEAQTGAAFLRDFLVNGMGQLGSGFTNTDAKNQATQLFQTAAQAAAATAAIQAQYQRQQATVPSGLLSYITTFGGTDGASLPAEFSGSDLKIRTPNGYCGIDASKGDGTYYATNNKVATTDDVQVTVVLADAGGLDSIATYTLFSSDSAYTTGAYFGLNGSTAFVGKYSRSGSTFTFTAPFMSWSGPLGQGLSATVYRKANNWVLEVGGDVKGTTSNSTVTTGASNRSGGTVVMQRKTSNGGWFDGNRLYDSLRLASVYFGDFYAKTTFYSGAKMTRPGGSAVNGPGHSYSLPQSSSTTLSGVLPSNFFSLLNFNSDDVTPNVANGSITINNPGLYYVHYDLPWTGISTGNANVSATAFATDVVINTVNHIPLVSQESQTIPAGGDGTGGGTIYLYWDKPEFVRLSAGDVVQIGYTFGLKAAIIGGTRTGTANMTYAAGSGFFGLYKMG